MAEQRSLGGALPPVASSLPSVSAGGPADAGTTSTAAAILPETEFTLLELADRLLHKGVVLVGEATISVAGVDLVYLGLNVVLTAVENLQPKERPGESQTSAEGGQASPPRA